MSTIKTGAVAGDLLDSVAELLSDEEDGSTRVLKDVSEFGTSKAPDNRRGHRADLGRAEEYFEIAVAVLAEIGDPLTLFHP